MESEAVGGTQAGKALRVLIVDDNRDAADSLGVLLRMWGYTVRVAYDGETALQMVQEFKPDCLLLDIAMPRMDGYVLARRLREKPELGGAKMVALTAYSDATSVRRIQEAGFDYHLVKPADPSDIERLLDMLDEVIRLAGKTEQLARQNVVLANETKELLSEVKQDLREVKEEMKEIRDDIKEVKESKRDNNNRS